MYCCKNYADPLELDVLPVLNYIENSWNLLLRDNNHWYESRIDTKLDTQDFIIYLPKTEKIKEIRSKFKSKQIKFKYLPANFDHIKEHGLLYLPYPYIVPGGRFNEMYGWDSFFIELGLLEQNQFELAKNLVENLLYEIKNYGMILNANRTYYLNRSQPPLLTEMILAYYEKFPDKAWLKSTMPAIEKLHSYWMSPEHNIPNIGLARYYAGGKGPTPEESPLYYKKVLDYYRTKPINDYQKSLFYNQIKNKFTALFFTADRTMRESGFDISAKHGPFGVGILDYAPVDLNVLIYQMERDAQTISEILGNRQEALKWKKIAKIRADRINLYLWDKISGYYFDYNFKTKKHKKYPFASTFYPLWAGIATQKQADAVVKHFPKFLKKGGLVTSFNNSGLQWDAPFGWAPMQYFAVLGLDKYGYKNLATDLAHKFISTINQGFEKHRQIFEKYDVETISTRTDNKIKFSYDSNEVGFGWTNGVYLVFIKYLKTFEQNQTSVE